MCGTLHVWWYQYLLASRMLESGSDLPRKKSRVGHPAAVKAKHSIVCLCVCVYLCVCACLFVCVWGGVFMCVGVDLCVCVLVYACVCTC